MNQYDTQILSLNFLGQGLWKRLRPAEKLIFVNVVTLNPLKSFLTQASTMAEGLQFHSSTQ